MASCVHVEDHVKRWFHTIVGTQCHANLFQDRIRPVQDFARTMPLRDRIRLLLKWTSCSKLHRQFLSLIQREFGGRDDK